jgi:hypothetical protein
MTVTPDLAQALAMVAETAADALDDWWIIGSTAVTLHGGDLGTVKDVDLMMSARDAEAFLQRVGVEPQHGTGDQHFCSEVFGLWREPPVPVEAFGGFRRAAAGAWREVSFTTREPIAIAGARVFVPGREELVGLLRAFGRPKDRERAGMLEGKPTPHGDQAP